MSSVSFTIQGKPMGKQRPRVTRHATFTPVESVNYETLVKIMYAEAGNKMLQGALQIEIKAFYPILKNTSKKKAELMLQGKIRPAKKPDLDNIAKIVCDALNSIAYKDDGQIVNMIVSKYYSEEARVEVTLTEIEGV